MMAIRFLKYTSLASRNCKNVLSFPSFTFCKKSGRTVFRTDNDKHGRYSEASLLFRKINNCGKRIIKVFYISSLQLRISLEYGVPGKGRKLIQEIGLQGAGGQNIRRNSTGSAWDSQTLYPSAGAICK